MARVKITSKSPPESTVYIGQSVPGLQQYTVFKNGAIPKHLIQLVADNTAIAGLIVPVSRLQEARKNIQVQGHILNFYAKKLRKEGVIHHGI